MTRFPHEHLPLVLFCPIAIFGHLSAQFALSFFVSPVERPHLERYHYHAQLLFSTLFMLVLQALRIRSAYIFAVITSFLLSGTLLPDVWGYVMPFALLTMGAVEAVTSVRLGSFYQPRTIVGKDLRLIRQRHSTSSRR